ncbi:MAG: sodium-dependent transporter, partial [Candidatus Heimdallarchaeota archaeon]|nr:sodium-dependent transporter [Candidatus Heimdallarchaeota archaeon]
AESGILWVDILDHFITNYGLVIIGILECILIGWRFKAKRLRDHINHAGGLSMTKFWDVCIKYIIPVVLLILIANSFSKDVSEPYGGYPWVSIIMIGRDWLIVALIASLFVAMRPWKRDLNVTDQYEK